MTKTITISLSLGSGPKAELLARQIKDWAGSMPISKAIRELLEAQINPTNVTSENISQDR